MGTFHTAYWLANGAGQTRRQRKSGAYRWYLPTRLDTLDLSLEPDVAQDIARAEQAIISLNSNASSLNSTEGVARLLLRSESVASSHIEGLRIGTKRLLRAELYEKEPDNLRFDKSALEVLGNIHAMADAIFLANETDPITLEAICEIHRSLVRRTSIERYGGIIRTGQNWVGGSSFNPLSADYIPPAPEFVPSLLDDLASFCNRCDLPALEQAALVHAQFESIHPFADGNGRTGRALIHLVLRRRGLCPNYLPPISLVLATRRDDYYRELSAFHYLDDTDAEHDAVNDWVSFFAACAYDASEESTKLEKRLGRVEESWRERLGAIRSGSTLELMLGEMKGTPVFTVNSMKELCGRSQPAVSEAIRHLINAGIVTVTTKGKRNRVFEVPDIIEAFNLFERKMASSAFDTAIAPPSRSVPYRIDDPS